MSHHSSFVDNNYAIKHHTKQQNELYNYGHVMRRLVAVGLLNFTPVLKTVV